MAERIQSAEQDIVAAQARIGLVDRLRAASAPGSARSRGPIVRLAAALQVMARRPPALALVQPGSLGDVVHVRALMASQLPLVEARTAGLRAAVAEGNRLRVQAGQAVATLRAGEQRLHDERTALTRLEAQSMVCRQALIDQSMLETDRATSLGEDARDIVDLMGRMDAQAALRDRLAFLPGPAAAPARARARADSRAGCGRRAVAGLALSPAGGGPSGVRAGRDIGCRRACARADAWPLRPARRLWRRRRAG